MRNRFIDDPENAEWNESVDTDNTAWLKTVVNDLGWPTIPTVSEEASNAAWLLVQHADRQPDFQMHCLELMKSLPAGEVKLANIAYLEDRVRVNNGQHQLYGTQFTSVNGELEVRPIENEAELEQRRTAVGLESFESYKRLMLETYDY